MVDLLTRPDVLQSFFEHLYEGVYVLDGDRKILFWNRGAERISGYSAPDVLGRRCSDNILVHVDENGNNICLGKCPVAATLKDGKDREVSVYLHHRLGHRVPVRVRVFPVRDDSGNISGAVEIFRDEGDEKDLLRRLESLEELALIDPLTRLPNRRCLEKALAMRLAGYQRHGNPPVGVIFVDIDHFKNVNDTYGHGRGDEVLKMVAQTMRGALREFDILGRWGGEEFVALILYADVQALEHVAERIRSLVELSWIDGNPPICVTVSVGGTLAMPDEAMETLIERADDLMYHSKRQGRNRVTLDLVRGLDDSV